MFIKSSVDDKYIEKYTVNKQNKYYDISIDNWGKKAKYYNNINFVYINIVKENEIIF